MVQRIIIMLIASVTALIGIRIVDRQFIHKKQYCGYDLPLRRYEP